MKMDMYIEIVDKLKELSASPLVIKRGSYMSEREDNKIYPEMRTFFRKYEIFDEFDDKMQVLENSPAWVCLDDLTDWLVARTRKSSAENALNEVVEYSNCESFKANYNLWLSGITVDTEIYISEHIILKPVFLSQHFSVDYNGFTMPNKTPTACIVYSYDHPKVQYNADRDMKQGSIYHKINLLVSAVLLIRKGLSVFPFAHSIDVDVDTPNFVNYGFQSSFIIKRYFGPPIIQIEASRIIDFFNKISELLPEKQNELLFLLGLLNQYCSEFDKVIKAVSFRTLLEAVYIGGRSINIAKDMKKNIMQNSGLTGKEKTKLGDVVIKLYDICSQAIHTGNLLTEELDKYNEYEKVVLDYLYADLIKLLKGEALERKITVSTIIDV